MNRHMNRPRYEGPPHHRAPQGSPNPALKDPQGPRQQRLQVSLALYKETPQVSLSSSPQVSPSLAPMTPAIQLFSFKYDTQQCFWAVLQQKCPQPHLSAALSSH